MAEEQTAAISKEEAAKKAQAAREKKKADNPHVWVDVRSGSHGPAHCVGTVA
jgi:hypothetical protein